MNPLAFDEQELLDIWREDCDERFQLVDEGEWVDGGKYQSLEVVFADTETNKTYSFGITRSGSYFSEYNYEIWDNAVEVKLEERTIIVKEWVAI